MASRRAIARLAAATGGMLCCLARPPHLMMVGGYLLDRIHFGDEALCLTVVGFDPELLRLALMASPFMHAGMLVGCAVDSPCSSLSAFAGRFALQFGCMLAAMAAAAHFYPGSTAAGLLAMLFAMIALAEGRRTFAAELLRLLRKVACRSDLFGKRTGQRPIDLPH